MLDGDLLEILVPVLLKANLLLAFRVKLVHDVIETLLEALLEDTVILVTCPHDRLVVKGVLNLNLGRKFVSTSALIDGARRLCRAVWSGKRHGTGDSLCCIKVSVRLELPLEVNLENGGAKTRELASRPLRQVCVRVHCHQMLHVLVLLLNNFVSWKHYKVLFVDDSVEEFDHGSSIV